VSGEADRSPPHLHGVGEVFPALDADKLLQALANHGGEQQGFHQGLAKTPEHLAHQFVPLRVAEGISEGQIQVGQDPAPTGAHQVGHEIPQTPAGGQSNRTRCALGDGTDDIDKGGRG
jgi:hypothetical protein